MPGETRWCEAPGCEATFTVSPSAPGSPRRFCSRRCQLRESARRRRAARQAAGLDERYCAAPDCGGMFLAGPGGDRGRGARYCCDQCCWRHNKQRARA